MTVQQRESLSGRKASDRDRALPHLSLPSPSKDAAEAGFFSLIRAPLVHALLLAQLKIA